MLNYLKIKENLEKKNFKDYSMSNNIIGDEYKDVLIKTKQKKISELISGYPDYKYGQLISTLKKI